MLKSTHTLYAFAVSRNKLDRLETKNAYCQSPDYLKDAKASSPLHVDVAIKKKTQPRLCFDNKYITVSAL
jgi:hypothetical protein